MTALDRELAKAEPKTLRYRLLRVAALLVRRQQRHLVLRLDETWPWAEDLADLAAAFTRLRTAFALSTRGRGARPITGGTEA